MIFRIGDITMGLTTEDYDISPNLPEAYHPFARFSTLDLRVDSKLRILRRPVFDVQYEQPAITVKDSWNLGFWQGKIVIKRFNQDRRLARMVLLQPDLRIGDVYGIEDSAAINGGSFHLQIYPLDMLVYVLLLGQGRGVLFHSAGITHQGMGFLFVGHSGAGKSTISRLWLEHEGVELLNDDRIIVRPCDGRFYLYGTPWHGEVDIVSARAAPLQGIYLLRHATQNRLTPLKPIQAIAELLTCSTTTFWDSGGMAFTMRFLEELVRQVPCYELGFVPDSSVVDFVRWQQF